MARPTCMNEQEIAALLSWVDARDRDVWVRMGMAVKSALGEAGFAIWDRWSCSAGNYELQAAADTWRSLRSEGGVTIGSLIAEARRNGCPCIPHPGPVDPCAQRQREADYRSALERQRRRTASIRRAARATAHSLWSMAGAVDPAHPYLRSKGIRPFGARQWQSQLLLPLCLDSDILSLQLIDAGGRKRFLKGGQTRGASLLLGQPWPGRPLLLCEGWATGCSLAEATGLAVRVCFSAGNLVSVARQLARHDPGPVLICADLDESGTGLQRAGEAAALLAPHAGIRLPEFQQQQREYYQHLHGTPPSDFNDLHLLAGLQTVQAQVCGRQTREVQDTDGTGTPGTSGSQ